MGQKQSISYKQLGDDDTRRQRSKSFYKQESSRTLTGSEASDFSANDSSTLSFPGDSLPQGVQEYYLKKRRSTTRTGVHWQEDPTGSTWLHHGRHWPREYATIRGTVVAVRGKKWLLAHQVKQLGSEKWHKAPKGAAIPFFVGNTYCLVSTKKTQRRPQIVSFRSKNTSRRQKVVTFADSVESVEA